MGSFALCVCAYNEESIIQNKIENSLEIRRTTTLPCEILLYIDAATDRTAEICRLYQDRITIVEAAERHGKTAGMNQLAELASADVLVFSDANVMVEPDALNRLGAYFADPAVGCVCGNLTYLNGELSATASVGTTYWRAEEEIKQLESDTGGVIGADGSIFAVRRLLHRPVPEDLIDDFTLSLSLLCEGYKVVRAADVRATEGATVDSADEFRRKIRIACQAFNVHRHMKQQIKNMNWLLKYKYYSHKYLRWFALINFSIGLTCAFAGVTAGTGWGGGLLAVSIAAFCLGLVLSGRHPALKALREILLALVATTLGVARSLRGDRFQTWHPPVSRAVRATNP